MHKKRIFKFFRNTVSIALAVSLMLGEIGTSMGTVYASEVTQASEIEGEVTETQTDAKYSGDELADNAEDGVILHAWNWSFNQIKNEIPQIAEAGFSAVQTSPVQPNKDGSNVNGTSDWWKFYQPVDFTIGNKLGSEADFRAMCEEAHKYGVKIIVDVVVQHLANVDSEGGNQKYNRSPQIPDYIRNNDAFWHNDNYSGSSDTDRYQMTHGPVGMPDLNTSNEELQNIIMNFFANVLKAGGDGFRFDTAKHIETPTDNGFASQFWPKAKATAEQVDPDALLFGEILNTAGPGGYSDIQKYTPYIRVTNSEYGHNVRAAAIDKNADRAKFTNNNIFGSNPEEWVLWNESHDTYAGSYEADPSRNHSEEEMLMAWCAVAARTSLAVYFSRPTAELGNAFNSVPLGQHTDKYRDKRIAGMNKFHNAFAGQPEYVTTSDNVLVVERGTTGVALINFNGSSKSVNIKMNKMADGTYTDKISGSQFTVSGGTLTGTIPDGGVAAVYNAGNPDKPNASASVSDGSSFTTDTLDVTFTVKNAASATYSIDGGAATAFTDSVKLTLGADTAYGSSVKVKIQATGKDGATVDKTFTYNKKEAGKLSKNTIYFTKPSGWSAANIYAYVPGASKDDKTTELTGEWPGKAMTDEGDGVYSYTVDSSVSSCKVIFNDGKAENAQQTPTDVIGETCGYDYTSGKAYTYDSSANWVAVDVNDATPTPKPTNTSAPTPTEEATPTPTQAPEEIEIASSLEDGSSFSTETKEITLTLKNAQKGTYCVDDGPVKEFTESAKVIIGKGKIADSKVTVKVTAEGNGKNAEKTFTYNKEYTASAGRAAVNAPEKEAVAEEAAVNAAPDTIYATNPGGQVGTKKTISSASDFDESMIIAQGIANDDQAAFRGTHEAPKFDLYAMYGAWDDTNLYIGLQYSNVIDVVDPIQSAPQQEDRKPYGPNADIPQMLVFDTGTGDYTDGTTNSTEAGQNPAWGIDVTYSGDAKVDKLFLYSPRSEVVNQALFPVTNGIVDYDKIVKTGYNYINAERGEKYSDKSLPGVSITWEDGFFGSHMYGINKSGGYGGYVPADIDDPSAPWVDFLTTNHDKKHDAFNIVTIPLELLGVTAADMQSRGIGVMAVATYGESGIGCLPMDKTMLDNATEPYTKGDDSTSHEKDDSDVITSALARLGGSGDIIPTPTKKVTSTPTPTQGGEDVTPTATTEPTQGATEIPTPTVGLTGEMNVNFGADRSAPQYNSTALTLKAVAKEGTAPYSYEFFLDNASVQKGENDSYTWKGGLAGAHTMKVVVTDSTGQQVTVEKAYDLEQDGDAPTPIPASVTPVPTSTTIPTPTMAEAEPTLVPGKLSISSFKAEVASKVGDTITLRAEAANATGTPLFMFTYVLNGEEVIVKKYGMENTASFVAQEAGAYTFKVYAVDENNTALAESQLGQFVVQENPNITTTPEPTDSVTPTPTNTVVPSVTKAPATPKPTATAKPTATPTAEPLPNVTGAPKKGMRVSDPKTKAEYKVTGTGSKKTVAYDKYTGSSKTVTIPNTIVISGATYKVTTVGANAFKNNKKLKTIIIPNNVTTIGSSAFYGCTSLGKVKKGVNIKKLGDKAFYNCKNLSSITMSKKLTSIGKAAFYKCTSLKKITINNKVNKIGTKAFYGCKKLKEITIRSTKLTSKNVGNSAFKGINAKAKIKVPKSKLKAYKKLLKRKGVSSKATVKKV